MTVTNAALALAALAALVGVYLVAVNGRMALAVRVQLSGRRAHDADQPTPSE